MDIYVYPKNVDAKLELMKTSFSSPTKKCNLNTYQIKCLLVGYMGLDSCQFLMAHSLFTDIYLIFRGQMPAGFDVSRCIGAGLVWTTDKIIFVR